MQRYFLDECSHNIKIEKNGEIYHHLSKVLRSKEGDVVEFCDLNGNCYRYKIVNISNENINFEVCSELLHNNEVASKVILAVSLLKNNNFELVLQKAVEIGVTDIIAYESSRTVVKSSNFNNKKIDRFKKIILEASEQSKRNVVPKFHGICKFKDVVDYECNNKFVAYEECSPSGDNLLINRMNGVTGDIMIVIGCEGGFSESEVEAMKTSGCEIVSLGKRILRAETAAINACSIVLASIECKKGE